MNWFKKVPFQKAFREEVQTEIDALEKAILTQRLKCEEEHFKLERMRAQHRILIDARINLQPVELRD